MKTTFIVALSVLLVVPTLALAQEWGPQPGEWEMTIQGNGTSDDDFDNHVFGIEAGLGAYLTRGWLVGVRQGVSYFRSELPGDDESLWNGSTRLFIDYHFGDRFRPYIGANVGYIYGDLVTDQWIGGPEAGIKIYLQRKAFLYVSGEYNFFFESSDDIEDNWDDGRFVYAVGFGLNW
jgi:opacity protein-like surface antigen